MPNFRRIKDVVLDPTVVRDNVFLAMICCCWRCSLIAVLFEPLTSKQSYHHSIDQKISICTQKSSSSPGKSYKNAFLSHQVQCCIGDGCEQFVSFVICRMIDTRCVIFCQGSLVQILSSVLIIWQHNQRWWFSSVFI
jgi:hypothetical protein